MAVLVDEFGHRPGHRMKVITQVVLKGRVHEMEWIFDKGIGLVGFNTVGVKRTTKRVSEPEMFGESQAGVVQKTRFFNIMIMIR